jgi:4-hydroxy-tetrahydrodipicolinate reductase
MIQVVISGASGKMGIEAVKAVSQESDMQVVGTSRRSQPLAQVLSGVKANVVVDLTHPDCVYAHAKLILEHGAHAVIGTTGLTADQMAEIDQLATSKNLSVLICPNFAIGAVLMMQFAAQAAKYMPRVEIIEYHHDQKADAPSGTALKTAQLIAQEQPDINAKPLTETELLPGVRGGALSRIPIHSVRLPGFVAHQEVIFGGLGQTLTLRHDTISRESFMPGVLLCIRKASTLKGVVYGLENIL